LDFKGLYDRDKMFWKDIQDVVISAACAPPGGGRNPLTPRFVRHFAILLIPSPTDMTLKVIFKVINWFVNQRNFFVAFISRNEVEKFERFVCRTAKIVELTVNS
jgi:hypothetical protein